MYIAIFLVGCRLAYHEVAGSHFHPLGVPTETTETVYVLALPEWVRVPSSINDVFPMLIPKEQKKWNDWCQAQDFPVLVNPPERFFQTALINVSRSTRVQTKVADVVQQALFILLHCLNSWCADRINKQTGRCNVPMPTDTEMESLPENQRASVLSRFEHAVELLTGDRTCIASLQHDCMCPQSCLKQGTCERCSPMNANASSGKKNAITEVHLLMHLCRAGWSA